MKLYPLIAFTLLVSCGEDGKKEGRPVPPVISNLSFASCGNIEHGAIAERERFFQDSVAFAESCSQVAEKQLGICNDGTIEFSGSASFESCTPREPASCGDLKHLETKPRLVYSTDKVDPGLSCESNSTTVYDRCFDGEIQMVENDDFPFASCEQAARKSCDGVADGATIEKTRYKTSSVAFGQSCESVQVVETATCNDGTLRFPSQERYSESCFVRAKGFQEFCEENSGDEQLSQTIAAIKDYTEQDNCQAAFDSVMEKGKLDLRGKNITDIRPLASFVTLNSLLLSNNNISDLSPLEYLENIVSLDLANNELKDIRSLDHLENLTILDLSNNQIKDIPSEFFDTKKELATLKINTNNLKSLEGLKHLIGLKTLEFDQNQIDSVEDLADLKKLRTISGDKNNISNLDFLQSNRLIEKISFDQNQITSVLPLENLFGLKELSLSFNQIDDIYDLFSLDNLETLQLGSNQIVNIPVFSRLEKLKIIDLSSNQIESIETLLVPLGIKWLNLSDNKIKDISVVSLMEQLEVLDLDQNLITDISPIKDLTDLRFLSLSSNQLDDVDFESISKLGSLELLNIDRNQFTRVDGLTKTKFPKLELVNFNGNPIEKSQTACPIDEASYTRLIVESCRSYLELESE